MGKNKERKKIMETYVYRKKNNDKIKTNLPIPFAAPVTAFLIAEKVLSYD